MVRIVFLGEFDCGKSTLIGRTLFDTGSITKEAKEDFLNIIESKNKEIEFSHLLDSFEEERKGELTIDTTQAFLKTENRECLLIDVPGHKELLKNMLTGISYANYAILVCDIEKLLEEQTKRHIYILKFLGINDFILVMNKMDKVNYEKTYFDEAKTKIESFFNKIDFYPKFIIPLSAKTGENVVNKSEKMRWYKGSCLLEALNIFNVDENKFIDLRMSVQDIYQRNKSEVIVGTVISGTIKQGDRIRIVPENLEAKVKKIVTFGKNKLKAQSNESIGLILNAEDRLRRGQIIYKGVIPRVTKQFWAKIFCIQNFPETEELVFKCSAQDVPCCIIKIKDVLDTATLETISPLGVLKQTNAAEVIIETNEPVVIEKFKEINSLGRFILHKEEKVLAIGIIP